MHAEAVLLVDDRQRQIVEGDVLLEQRMGADEDVDVAEREPVEDGLALAAALAAGEDGDAEAGGFGERRDGLEMLAREDFGRRHQRGLAAGLDHGGRGEQRDHRLAGADVALQQPQHALRLGEVGDDLVDRASAANGSAHRAAPAMTRARRRPSPWCRGRPGGACARAAAPSASWLASNSS